MKSHTVDRLASVALIALALVVYYAASQFPAHAPDAARYTKFIACTLGVLSALLLVTTRPKESSVTWFASLRPWLVTVVLTLAYIFAIQPLGFYLTSAVYVPLLAAALGLRRWGLIVLSTAALLVLVWLVFQKFLMVPIPMGTVWGF